MTLNLIADNWIPVFQNGHTVIIRPDQIAEPGVARLAWPRADFNLACLELLIGLVSMADPPTDDADWLARFEDPDAARLRDALAPFAAHFALAGDGPRFLQDEEAFECTAKLSDVKPVDMLYIDSAGDLTVSKNADLTVKRNRFTSLTPAEAAMALHTLQAFAPSGGAGNRTSMRGGGPMTTLVQPRDEDTVRFPLWRLIFANVLPGVPLAPEEAKNALPWLRPTRTSKQGQITAPQDTHPLEVFFGMPRRLRLVFDGDRVTGVIQRPHGTNYQTWQHPLTPYYREKEDSPQWLPRRPKAGRLSYRNWQGISMEPSEKGKGVSRTARTVNERQLRSSPCDFELIVGGWAMDNMKPVDFTLDTYPAFFGVREDDEDRIRGLVEAANTASGSLRKSLKSACKLGGTPADIAIEVFFAETEDPFVGAIGRIIDGAGTEVEEAWYRTLRARAVLSFDQHALGGLEDRDIGRIEERVIAKRNLLSALRTQVRKAMDLPIQDRKEKQA